jgi:hypothetical protein
MLKYPYVHKFLMGFSHSLSWYWCLGRYDLLRRYLQKVPVGTDRLELTFNDIEGIIGAGLPASAYRYRAWWANDKTHVHARAWMDAGWGGWNL